MRHYKTILFFLLLSINSPIIKACEICGCGVGNFYMGILPNFDSKFVGLRYQYLKYHTEITGDKSQFSNDTYQTVELWTGWNIGKRWRVMAFVPYQINKQSTDDGIKQDNGLGDITVLGNFSLLHTYHLGANKKTTEHQLWIGAGIKAPTGSYHLDLTEPDANIGDVNAQMGTGSTDFLLNSSYVVRINKWGVNTTANYKINTTNSDQYYFGNRFTANSLVYYSIQAKKVGIAPNAGLLYEHAAANYLNSEKVDQTGGYATFATLGSETSYKKIAAGINFQLPLTQNFAEGQTSNKLRALAHVTLAF